MLKRKSKQESDSLQIVDKKTGRFFETFDQLNEFLQTPRERKYYNGKVSRGRFYNHMNRIVKKPDPKIVDRFIFVPTSQIYVDLSRYAA